MLLFGLFKKKKKQQKLEPKPEPKPEPMPESEPTVEEEVDKPKKPRKLAYHVTKHPQGGWQLKKGKAERALKRFDTQKEAIDYAKQLEKERGISFVIHKADGSTRKKTY